MSKQLRGAIVLLGSGVIIGGLVGWVVWKTVGENPKNRIAEFYNIEATVGVSPHEIRTKLETGEKDFIVVDLRSKEEYVNEHIIGAINIPGFDPGDGSEEAQATRVYNAFKVLDKDKDIITYCYSHACMLSRKVGQLLATRGIFTKHLTIGWSEWRSFWKLWNPSEDRMDAPAEYVASGENPGDFKPTAAPAPCGEGSLAC